VGRRRGTENDEKQEIGSMHNVCVSLVHGHPIELLTSYRNSHVLSPHRLAIHLGY
jgi:hypothetical protein